jgi:hypothetical protein
MGSLVQRIAVTVLLLVSVMALAQADTRKYPDVINVSVTQTGDARYRFDVTLSSPYDSPERYADAFRVKTAEGQTLGVRELLHHHANEQPFTRSLNNVEIPDGIGEVIVQGRDQTYGYGGAAKSVALPGR